MVRSRRRTRRPLRRHSHVYDARRGVGPHRFAAGAGRTARRHHAARRRHGHHRRGVRGREPPRRGCHDRGRRACRRRGGGVRRSRVSSTRQRHHRAPQSPARREIAAPLDGRAHRRCIAQSSSPFWRDGSGGPAAVAFGPLRSARRRPATRSMGPRAVLLGTELSWIRRAPRRRAWPRLFRHRADRRAHIVNERHVHVRARQPKPSRDRVASSRSVLSLPTRCCFRACSSPLRC